MKLPRAPTLVAIGAVVSLAGATAGCATRATGVEASTGVRVLVTESNAVLERSPSFVGFRLTAIVANDADTKLYMNFCGPEVEQERSSGWTFVWVPTCVTSVSTPAHVPPHDSVIVQVPVFWRSGDTGPGRFPSGSEVPGRYRVRFGLGRRLGADGQISKLLPRAASTSMPVSVR